MKNRPEIPKEKIIEVKRNIKKIDFSEPYTFIYFGLWFNLLTFPIVLTGYVLVMFCRMFYGLRISGRKNKRILRKRGCITVSNHCHYFDTVFASHSLFPRRLYISVVQRNFEVPIVRTILRVLKAFPIPSNSLGLKMITPHIGEALNRGHHVHFLPEGELVYLSQTIYRFRLGAFYQSYLHQVPVLPMVYVFNRRRLFGKELGPNLVKMRLAFGEPIYPPRFREGEKFPVKDLEAMCEAAASWMERTIEEYHGRQPHGCKAKGSS
jgi:1-acyl-sn-glycerol-3-phosphate acyltransferase